MWLMKRMLVVCVLCIFAVSGLASEEVKYIVTFKMTQSHLTLDIGTHIKDSMNTTTFQIPVDKEFYDAVKVGTVINKDFRAGSFLMEGSLGNWKLTVDKKELRKIEKKEEKNGE